MTTMTAPAPATPAVEADLRCVDCYTYGPDVATGRPCGDPEPTCSRCDAWHENTCKVCAVNNAV